MATGIVDSRSMILRPGNLRAVDRVADGEGQYAADHGGDHADLHRVPDRGHRQRIVEDGVEVNPAVRLHVEHGVEVLEEQEPAEGRDHQGDRRQHHDDEQVDESQAEGEPAPRPEIEAARAEGLAGHGGEAATRKHALLRPDEDRRDHHQQDRDRGGGIVERRAPGGELEDVGREHADVGRRAQRGGNAVDAEHHDEGQQRAREDRRRDQREGDREEGREGRWRPRPRTLPRGWGPCCAAPTP